jgi:hypothetical protein
MHFLSADVFLDTGSVEKQQGSSCLGAVIGRKDAGSGGLNAVSGGKDAGSGQKNAESGR